MRLQWWSKASGRYRTVLVALLLVLTAGIVRVRAADPPGELKLSTSGLPINLVTPPGTTVTADIRIRNEGASAEDIKVGLMKFGASGDEGRPELMDRGPGDDYFDWVSFSPSIFRIVPNEFKTVRATFKVPKSAAFGYYYAVTFSRASEEKPAPGQQGVKGSLATLVLLDAKVANAKRELTVLEFSTDHRVYEYLPANFRVKLNNSGNVHLVPHGDITVSKGDEDVARLQLNPQQGNVLPKTNRIFGPAWSDGFPLFVTKTENGKPVTKLEWDWSKLQKFRFGKYTANLLLVYDDGKHDVPIEAKVTFYVFPWKLFALIALVLLVLGFGIYSTLRTIWKGTGKVRRRK